MCWKLNIPVNYYKISKVSRPKKLQCNVQIPSHSQSHTILCNPFSLPGHPIEGFKHSNLWSTSFIHKASKCIYIVCEHNAFKFALLHKHSDIKGFCPHCSIWCTGSKSGFFLLTAFSQFVSREHDIKCISRIPNLYQSLSQ